MVKKISKSLAKDFETFASKVEAICKKSPLKVRYVAKVRGGDDEVVLKVNDDTEVSTLNICFLLTPVFPCSYSVHNTESKTRAKMSQAPNSFRKYRKCSYHGRRTKIHAQRYSTRLRTLWWQPKVRLNQLTTKNNRNNKNNSNKTKVEVKRKSKRRSDVEMLFEYKHSPIFIWIYWIDIWI